MPIIEPYVPWNKKVHDILIDGVSMFEYLDLIPISRPYVSPPSIKTNKIEVPGAHGEIDLSTNLTGYPLYGRRTGSWEFLIMYERPDASGRLSTYISDLEPRYVWLSRYNRLMEMINNNYGETVVVLCDSMYVDQEGNIDGTKLYYYKGSLTVSAFKPNKNYSTITVDYDLEPFRYSNMLMSELNPDKFGVKEINSLVLTDIMTVNSSDMWMYDNYYKSNETVLNPASQFISQPVYPTISVWSEDGNGIEIGFINNELGMNRSEVYGEGVHEVYRFTITPGCKFMAKGKGAIQIDWRNRAL